MCQLNVFLISNEIPIDSVMNLMNDFDIDGDCITTDFKSDELTSKYNFYISNYYRCDCNSFVTRFSDDENNDINIIDKLKRQHNAELKKLYELKEFMSSNNYTKKKELFIKSYEELQSKNTYEFRELLNNNAMMYDALMHYSQDFNKAADDLDDLIKKAELEDFKYEFEYIQLKNWILNVIDKYGKIMYFSYWQDNSIPKIQSVRKITTDQISFDLFARLKYLHLLDISK